MITLSFVHNKKPVTHFDWPVDRWRYNFVNFVTNDHWNQRQDSTKVRVQCFHMTSSLCIPNENQFSYCSHYKLIVIGEHDDIVEAVLAARQ